MLLEQLVLAFGSILMATILGWGIANAQQVRKRGIFLALAVFLAVLVALSIIQGWRPERIAFGGIVLGLILAEWGLPWALRKCGSWVFECDGAC